MDMEMVAKIELTTQNLPVTLTQKELIGAAKELARSANELRDTEIREMEVTTQYAAELKKLKAIIDTLSIKISNGYEYRDIECVWTSDFTNDSKTLTRNDTGEIVTMRELTQEDRQRLSRNTERFQETKK